jgi:glycosyltransferase involved in cell wall biosynthesis
MHENLPKEILTKNWVSRPLRRLLSATVKAFQVIACRSIPTVFAETSYARDFPKVKSGVVVLNYPLVDALVGVKRPKRQRFTVGYIGGVSTERGADVVADALAQLRLTDRDVGAVFVGPVSSDLSNSAPWQGAVAEGWLAATGRLKPEDGWLLMAECHVGIAILRPSPNFVESYPTKLFEYMALGLPVVVSDFPLWRAVVEDAGCGFAVDPTNVDAVAQALRWMHENPEKAKQMGERGRQTVLSKYNWTSEFTKLRALYEDVLAH